ncbi:hypothetical protein CASFOL_012518 [Castilleja foliolosa]|uniref:Ubiquitin-like protease family profile domain-containing protein n=1 Tax=Castilleja foliolosa TaxID=1961234 RepID=A0ABD3DHV5_9LAMI
MPLVVLAVTLNNILVVLFRKAHTSQVQQRLLRILLNMDGGVGNDGQANNQTGLSAQANNQTGISDQANNQTGLSVQANNQTGISAQANNQTGISAQANNFYLRKEKRRAPIRKRVEEEKAKRLKAQQIQSHNKCPQRCSRGGYEVLTQKIIDEKLKARKAASDDPSEIIQPPSPPSRHEAWKRARIKPSGEYINPETSVIAEKILAFEAYQVVKGIHSNTLTKPKWVYPKCCQQDVGDAECGLFVMRHMLEIIKLDITNSFEK